jgi:microcystin-dependent protein
VHQGTGAPSSFPIGQLGGVETVTLTTAQMPAHNHPMLASSAISTLATPQNNVTGQAAAKLSHAGNPSVFLNPQSVTTTGGSQPHDNFQPYLCVSFIISLFGIFPSQS